MFVTFGRRVSCILLLCIFTCIVSAQQYGPKDTTLYVAKDTQDSDRKITIINRNVDSNDGSHYGRLKREATTLTSPDLQKNISTWTTHLNDSHQQLMVHWVGEGSNVIICLARDSSPRNKGGISPSTLFISYDYGKNFTNKTESFRLGDAPDSGYAQLDKFFNHPKYPEFCVFVDSSNKKLFYTSDNGITIHRSDLSFSPSELAFDEEYPNKYVILDKLDSVKKLYLTLDGGKSFKMIQSFVKTVFWSSGPGYPKMFYVERWKPNLTSTVFSASDPTDLIRTDILFEDAKDFQIKGDFMFVTRQSNERNTLDLYISHQRGPFFKAEFQTDMDLLKFHIADVTDKRIFVSVMHSNFLANLYVSEISGNFTQYNFVVSLPQILCYFPDGNWKNSWLEDVTEDPFNDLYRVEGLHGIYIASRVDTAPAASLGPEHLVSMITFDHGVTWSPIKPPTEDENGKPLNCHIENSCSLHLCQKFSQLYPVTSPPGNVTNGWRSASIMSSKSAPGVIMATGVMGKSLKGIPGVYLSRDAGLTWKRILKDYYFFNYGDHGGVLVAVKYFKSRGETRKILYSTNEGIEWNSYQFNADDLRIYGLMTEPGENTTTFTMFGSANDQHQWIIITIDLKNTFPRNCTADDYKFWSPSAPNTTVSCVLGTRKTFQRRLAYTNCYNGINYDRPVRKEVCECTRRDFECDFGFMLSAGNDCIRNKSVKHDPYAPPKDCRPGQFYKRTRGYRKIDGDMCTISGYMAYAPDRIPCTIDEPLEFMVVALRDKIAMIDLSDKTVVYPVKNQKNIVTVEFDIKNTCMYWADIELDKIKRQCYNNETAEEVFVGTDLASIEGMALDWISNVLFFVDGMRQKIEAVRTDLANEGRMRVTILDSNVLRKPRGIAVHPQAGYLFWTDWDRDRPAVSRSNLDGTEVKKLFGKPVVQWPNGITVDHMSERIYWVDAMEDYIASCDLNGGYFRRLLWNDDKVSHPFAVGVLKDTMYWDDWKAKSIFVAEKDTGANVTTINDSFSGLMDLKVYAHFVQHGTNACANKNVTCDGMCLGGPGNTYSCLCPDGFNKVNGKCVCRNGMAPMANMTCPKTAGTTCSADQFTCNNGMCIMSTWRCDGNNDCGDMSDEADCLCAPPMISCDGTRCYLPHWKCDGDLDCFDMSDEKDCGPKKCSPTEFQCDNGYCIDKKWLCDGDNDCKDHSDERNCTVQVKRPDTASCDNDNGFMCGNSSICVPNSWLCDGEPDCPGAEDESPGRCIESTCSPYMFRCPSGKCIFKTWVCDGENDCSDEEQSDEKDCTTIGQSKMLPHPTTEKPNFPFNNTCLEWMFKCDNGNCIPYWWHCDGTDDCGDHSDEVGCGVVESKTTTIQPHTQTTPKCDINHFMCSQGVCIPLSWVCDGAVDCGDGADERDCPRRPTAPSRAPTTCAAPLSPCDSGVGCVHFEQICDGTPQCADHSDEAHCPTTYKYNPTEDCFRCDDDPVCLDQYKICNGRQDCYDGTDEANCSSSDSEKRVYQSLSIGVDQSSINSTSFLISCWMAQQKMVLYSFLPSIAKVSDNNWRNMTWTNDSVYRFTDLEPYTNYNVTFYIKDSKSNRTYPSMKFVNTTTGEGVPSPPLRITVRQMIGSRVNVIWDRPQSPRGAIQYYTLYYSPPQDPLQLIVPANGSNTVSIVVAGFFKPKKNYSFWVTATNNAFTSDSSEVANITFDEGGDVDDLVNVTIRRLNSSFIHAEWNPIRGVEGYKIEAKLPSNYAKLDTITTKYNNVTLEHLPPGVNIFINIRAFKKDVIGEPFNFPIITKGIPDEVLNLTAILLKEKRTSVQLKWSPPIGDRYKGKELQYEVHYTNFVRTPVIGEWSNDTKIVTKETSVTIENLHACEAYEFAVGILGGPLSNVAEIITRENAKAPVKNLRVNYDSKTMDMTITWNANCDALQEPVTYRLEITEETRDKKSVYELPPSRLAHLKHVLHNVPVGGRYNVCVHAAIEGAAQTCVSKRERDLDAPRAVVAYRSESGHVLVHWDDALTQTGHKMKYQVILSEKEIPEDLLHPTEDMKTMVVESSPLLMTAPSTDSKNLYVSVRTITPEGFYSDLSEVQTLTMDAEAEPSTTVAALWWGGVAALIAAVALGGALVHAALRHRRLARSFLRYTAHTPRYDSRRGQATLGDHDDDDVPPIHGFSDDEPLVIA